MYIIQMHVSIHAYVYMKYNGIQAGGGGGGGGGGRRRGEEGGSLCSPSAACNSAISSRNHLHTYYRSVVNRSMQGQTLQA